jgi:hypothetical protein
MSAFFGQSRNEPLTHRFRECSFDKETAMNNLIRVLTLASLCAPPAAGVFAQNANPPEIKPNSNAPFDAPRATRAFLGVYVGPAFRKFPPGNANPQQGLVVRGVAPNSPAEKAGIKSGDVLTSLDGQKLVAADQLARLVRGDQPNQKVVLELLRDGKAQKLEVALGEAPAGPSPEFLPPTGPMGPMRRQFGSGMGPPWSGPNFGEDMNSLWQSFDSLSIKKTGDDKFHVEAQYLEKDAKTNKTQVKKYDFEGTPAEIHRAIEQAQDLTPPRRFQLHRMLQFPGLERGFPNMRPRAGTFRPPSAGPGDAPSQ